METCLGHYVASSDPTNQTRTPPGSWPPVHDMATRLFFLNTPSAPSHSPSAWPAHSATTLRPTWSLPHSPHLSTTCPLTWPVYPHGPPTRQPHGHSLRLATRVIICQPIWPSNGHSPDYQGPHGYPFGYHLALTPGHHRTNQIATTWPPAWPLHDHQPDNHRTTHTATSPQHGTPTWQPHGHSSNRHIGIHLTTT
jgi:hypothetical protein